MNELSLPWGSLPHVLAEVSLVLASVPAALFFANLLFYRRLPQSPVASTANTDSAGSASPSLSILIPARNEEEAIAPALRAVLADPDPRLEVIVLDDHSTDTTAARVQEVAANDPRVRLVAGQRLPDGWCGKQHACWQLAQAARGELLVFLDADVRLESGALPRIAHYFSTHPSVHLGSGVPRQITGTFLEKLLIPLIHTVLLGYLPMAAAQLTRWSAFAAGCGQLFVARRAAYFASQGHQGIRASLHDGVQLPRSFRRHGFQTGLFDATDLARCRMYSSAVTVWRGLGKNATEGMAHPVAILPWSFLLLGGHVLPWVLLLNGFVAPTDSNSAAVIGIAGVAASLGLITRLASAWKFQQSLLGAVLHPAGITALVTIQWEALVRRWRGHPMEWRGRQYAHPASVPVNPPTTA